MKWDRSMAAPGLEHSYSPCLVQLAVFNQNQMLLHQLQIMQVLYMLTYKSFAVNWCFHLQKKRFKGIGSSMIMPLLAPFRDGQTQLTAIMAFSVMLSIIEVTVWRSCEYQPFSFFREKTLHWKALSFSVLVCPCVLHLMTILSLQFLMNRVAW